LMTIAYFINMLTPSSPRRAERDIREDRRRFGSHSS
jgi:hypothetical protein